MPGHDHSYYEELCALAAGGHLDNAECVEFQAHVKECGECRTTYRELAALITQDLPQAQGGLKQKLAAVMTKPLPDSRQRFLRRAPTEGVVFSREVEAPVPSGSWHFRPATVFAAATVLVAAAVSLTAYHFRSMPLPDTARAQDGSTAVQQIAELAYSRDQLQARLSEQQKTIESKDGEVNQWRSQAAVQALKINEMQRDLQQSRHTAESLQSAEEALKDSRSRLSELEGQAVFAFAVAVVYVHDVQLPRAHDVAHVAAGGQQLPLHIRRGLLRADLLRKLADAALLGDQRHCRIILALAQVRRFRRRGGELTLLCLDLAFEFAQAGTGILQRLFGRLQRLGRVPRLL